MVTHEKQLLYEVETVAQAATLDSTLAPMIHERNLNVFDLRKADRGNVVSLIRYINAQRDVSDLTYLMHEGNIYLTGGVIEKGRDAYTDVDLIVAGNNEYMDSLINTLRFGSGYKHSQQEGAKTIQVPYRIDLRVGPHEFHTEFFSRSRTFTWEEVDVLPEFTDERGAWQYVNLPIAARFQYQPENKNAACIDVNIVSKTSLTEGAVGTPQPI